MEVTKYKLLVCVWNPSGITEEEQTRRTAGKLLEERSHPNINLTVYCKRKKISTYNCNFVSYMCLYSFSLFSSRNI